MWSMNVIILLLFCYACLSTCNGAVNFHSRNFHNVLHWDPVTPTASGEKILYSVEYRNYSDPRFHVKKECQDITALSCDLTAETPSVYDVYYLARLYVNGLLHGSTIRFLPLAETVFGPPILTTYATPSSLHIDVTLPLGPKGVSIEETIINSTNGPVKTSICHTLKIISPEWAEREVKSTSGKFVVEELNSQTEFCGNVVYRTSPERGRVESENAHFCITLPADPNRILWWSLLSAALLVLVVLMSVVCSCIYVKGGKNDSMPKSLEFISSKIPTVLKSPDGNLIISKPVVGTQSDIIYAKIMAVPTVGGGAYSPHNIPCQVWGDSAGSSAGAGIQSPAPNPRDTSSQSSEIYSTVVLHVPPEENEDLLQVDVHGTVPPSSSRQKWSEAGSSPELTLHAVAPPSGVDDFEINPDRQLLLQTVRDPEGKLMLPMLSCSFQSGTGSPVLNPERKLLLSDLDSKSERTSLSSLHLLDSSEWSDSGCDDSAVNTPTHHYCNTHYFPSQAAVPGLHSARPSDGNIESGYKQNWMPAELLGAASKDKCEYRRTNFPWTFTAPDEEEGGEVDEDAGQEEEARQILLGDWGLQIQE